MVSGGGGAVVGWTGVDDGWGDLIRLDFGAVTVCHSVLCVLARTVTRDDKGDCCRSSTG